MKVENYGNMKCDLLQFGTCTSKFQQNVLLPLPKSKMQKAPQPKGMSTKLHGVTFEKTEGMSDFTYLRLFNKRRFIGY
jgi:hypothetical protein